MPRFHFNIRDGEALIHDCEGEELPDLATAEFEARMNARALIIERLNAGEELDGQEIEITDDDGKVLESMKVRDVISPIPKS